MTGFRSVLCAIDFSEPSRLALQHAERIARLGKATLRVVYVDDPLLIAAAAALHHRGLAAQSARELRAFVDTTLAPGSRARLRVTTRVSTGQPAAGILEAAARAKADLIVVGTRGLTGAQRLILGSTATRVLQQATVPVLAVPGTATRRAPRPRRRPR